MQADLHTDSAARELTVDEWRFQRLIAAGWPETDAVVLAAKHEIDLHLACDLLTNGCPPALAWEILR